MRGQGFLSNSHGVWICFRPIAISSFPYYKRVRSNLQDDGLHYSTLTFEDYKCNYMYVLDPEI